MIDIVNHQLMDIDSSLYDILLIDRTTRKNICWATDQYKQYGLEYYPQESITPGLVVGRLHRIIQPRAMRTHDDQGWRTREKAEVFTPSWLCNKQNNLVDDAWFGRVHVFNTPTSSGWIVNEDIIAFDKKKTWESYVDKKTLEVACGEAPYLVSRYDSVTGKAIAVKNRIGLLDRKLRVVSENTDTEEAWYKWAVRAYQSVYGYDYQGDNVFIARQNLLLSFIDHMEFRFSKFPTVKQLKNIARIISWNIWQMDGLTFTIPFSNKVSVYRSKSLFDFNESDRTKSLESKVFDWRSKRSTTFKNIVAGV